MNITIRTAVPDDAEQILEIYAPYVRDTAISFEYEIPTMEEFSARIENTLKKYPYFVAESGKEIVGYSYAGAFKDFYLCQNGKEACGNRCETVRAP